jgi:hypothetical protein
MANMTRQLGTGSAPLPFAAWSAGACVLAAALATSACGGSKNGSTAAPPGTSYVPTTGHGGSGGAGGAGGAGQGGTAHGGHGHGGGATGGAGHADGGLGGAGQVGGGGAGNTGTAGSGQGGQGIAYVCSVNTNWIVVPGSKPAIATPDDDTLGAITPDELTIAFTSTPSDVVRWADRADSAQDFGAPQDLPAAAGYYALDAGVALSPDGLRIVVLSSDKKKLAQLTRKSRSDAFAGAPDPAPFAAINGSLAAGESLGDPIVTGDDAELVYSQYSNASATTIHVAKHASPSAAWTTTADAMGGKELDAANGKRRRPTGISADRLTLYFWDEQSSTQRAGWREHEADPFTTFLDYPQLSAAAPSGNCKKMYFTGAGALSKDILLSFPQ